MSEAKRTIACGLLGILLACPIIATMTLAPWTRENSGPNGSAAYGPGLPGVNGAGYLDSFLDVTNFTEPYKLGGEASVLIGITSSCDLNVTVTLGISSVFSIISEAGSRCVSFIDGGLVRIWQLSLKANASKLFVERVRVVSTGFASIWMKTDVDETAPGPILQKIVKPWLIGVWEKGIIVTKESPPSNPVSTAVGHSSLDELGGVGGEFSVYFHMAVNDQIQDAIAQVVLPNGLAFLNGTLTCWRGENKLWSRELDESLTWSGNMEEDTSMRLDARVKAVQSGNWTVILTAGKSLPDGPWFGNATVYGLWWFGNSRVCGFRVSEHDVSSWSGDMSLNPYPSFQFVIETSATPPFQLELIPSFPYPYTPMNPTFFLPRLTSTLSISDFQPPGIGGEVKLTLTLITNCDAANVTVCFDIAEFVLVAGNLAWNGGLKTGIPQRINITIEATRVGIWRIAADACWYKSPLECFTDTQAMKIYVYRDGVVAIDDDPWSSHIFAAGSSLYLEPAVTQWIATSHKINDTLVLQVRVANVTNLGAIQFHLGWDPTKLKLINVEEGDFLKILGCNSTWIVSDRQVNEGFLLAGHSLFPWTQGANITGSDSGLLATLTFQVLDFTDRTEIYFANTIFKNYWIPGKGESSYEFPLYYFESETSATFVYTPR